METGLPTLKDMATRLNVSVSTVSRALIGSRRIGLGTRLKVQQLAKELGYEPNSQAVNFKLKRTFVIGVIVPFVRDDFFAQAICGIESVTSQHNYTILFGQSYDDVENEMRLVEVMRKQRVDGLIISLSQSTVDTGHIDTLSKFNIPVVYFGRVPQADVVNKVYCNVYRGAGQMVSKLLAKGIRRIALINGPRKLAMSNDCLKGYIDSMAKCKIKVDMQLVEETDFSREGTHEAMRGIMNLKAPPEAVISFNDYVHMDAVQFAGLHEIKVNEEVIFASLANLPITEYTMHPPLIALEQYPYKQGEAAMKMLLRIITDKLNHTDNLSQPYVELISPTLHNRGRDRRIMAFSCNGIFPANSIVNEEQKQDRLDIVWIED